MTLFVFDRESLNLVEITEVKEATRDRLAVVTELVERTSRGVFYVPLTPQSVIFDPVDFWQLAYGFEAQAVIDAVRKRFDFEIKKATQALSNLRGESAGFEAVYGDST